MTQTEPAAVTPSSPVPSRPANLPAPGVIHGAVVVLVVLFLAVALSKGGREPAVVNTPPPRPSPTESAGTSPTDPQAQLELGMRHLNDDGVPQSDTEAVKWLRKAAEQGNACVFHAKVDTDSTAKWTVIPRQTGHRFQGKLDT